MSTGDIDRVLMWIRAKTTLPKLDYHFAQHGADFGAADMQQYLDALIATLVRADLRVFSHLTKTSKGWLPRWTLVAPDGATVLYDEIGDIVWSFYRPEAVERRMNAMTSLWVELIPQEGQWHLETQWTW